jgi:hypothetical protein
MARTAITPQKPTSAGLALATEPANVDGHSLPHDALLVVANASAGPINVTLVTPGVVDGDLAVPDRIVAVPAGASRYFGALDRIFRQADGTAHVDLSAVASVTVAAIS